MIPPTTAPLPPRPPPRPSSGTERLVALALGVLGAVLAFVYVDLRRAPPPAGPPPFDFVNPLLSVQAGECVEVASSAQPDHASWIVIRTPGPVLRPHTSGKKVVGWSSPQHPDHRALPAYLVGDVRPAPTARGGGEYLPPGRDEPHVFPLSGFGLPIEAMGVLHDIGHTEKVWGGQRQRAYAVGLKRFGKVEGPWVVVMAQGVPALGTMSRTFIRGTSNETQVFRVPETCR